MFTEKIKALNEEISTITNEISENKATIKNLLNEDKLEEAKAMKTTVDEANAKLTELKNDLKLYEESTQTETKASGKPVATEEKTIRQAVNEFIRSKGAVVNGLELEGKGEVKVPMNEITPTTDGVTKTDTTPITSEEISTTPVKEIKTVADLKQFTNIHKATKAKGSHPILKRATTRMISVAELEKNPALAKPEFDDIDWEVATYRGAIPLSQESVDDADVDLVSIVAQNVNEIKVNTTNFAIAEAIKKMPAKAIATLDDLKAIFNVELDPAYTRGLYVSQTFYNWLDTLKDGNGRYLLQDSILSASGKAFAGNPVVVISDEFMGANSAFVGDLKRAILFADRKDLGLRWADNEIYGQYLQAVIRFGVSIADEKAGFYVTQADAPAK